MLLYASNYVVYDTSVWTEAGYTLQRYIGSSATVGIKIFVLVLGVGLVANIIKNLSGIK